ncbi:MAG: hypothetical protein GX641_04125, partial [Mollicutes bacterium]|nr:hypothetical protein [Mollicutes bacterium]
MNRTQTGRHINNVAEAAQVSAGHGGDTFKAPTMAYHSPAIVKPLESGYSHTQDDYAYQQTVSSQFWVRQQAKDAIRNAPSVQQSEDFALIMEALDSFSVNSEYYYELARQDAVNSLIASDKSRLTMAGIE